MKKDNLLNTKNLTSGTTIDIYVDCLIINQPQRENRCFKISGFKNQNQLLSFINNNAEVEWEENECVFLTPDDEESIIWEYGDF